MKAHNNDRVLEHTHIYSVIEREHSYLITIKSTKIDLEYTDFGRRLAGSSRGFDSLSSDDQNCTQFDGMRKREKSLIKH